ncbi:aldo/keto reductase [Streptomyces sp. NPDC002092]
MTGTATPAAGCPPNDLRAHDARWQPGNHETNQALVRDLGAIAEWKGCTVAQVALGRLLAQGQDVVPAPGTRSARRVAENVAAAHLTFTPEGLDLIGSLLPNGAVGDRYPRADDARLVTARRVRGVYRAVRDCRPAGTALRARASRSQPSSSRWSAAVVHRRRAVSSSRSSWPS